MSAAVNNRNSDRNFRANITRLIEHFDVNPPRINVRSPEENGDCESSHRHFKDYGDQRFRIRPDRRAEDWRCDRIWGRNRSPFPKRIHGATYCRMGL